MRSTFRPINSMNPLTSPANQSQSAVRFSGNTQTTASTSNQQDTVSFQRTTPLSKELKKRSDKLRNIIIQSEIAEERRLTKVRKIIQAVPEVQRPQFIQQSTGDFGETALHVAAGGVLGSRPLGSAITRIDGETGWRRGRGRVMSYSAVTYTITDGVIGSVKMLLDALPVDQRREFLQKQDSTGRTALQKVVWRINIGDAIGGWTEESKHWDMVGLLLAYGADASTLTETQRQRALDHVMSTRERHVNTLVNPNATSAEVREAVRWLQLFPPNGGALNWQKVDQDRRAEQEAVLQNPEATQEQRAKASQWLQTYQAPVEKCRAFLQPLANTYTHADNDDMRIELLEQMKPVLDSGIIPATDSLEFMLLKRVAHRVLSGDVSQEQEL